MSEAATCRNAVGLPALPAEGGSVVARCQIAEQGASGLEEVGRIVHAAGREDAPAKIG